MASKGKENRIVVTLACTVCKQRNYTTSKNKKNNPERLELRKFCPTDRVHTIHRETKQDSRSGTHIVKGTDRERLNVANKMTDNKKNTSQSEIVESRVRSGEKEQSKNAKAMARERDERKGRETRESRRRETKSAPTTQSRFRNNRVVRFIREAYQELRYKVTWPTFQEARNMTFVVIALSVAVGLLLGAADLGLFNLFQLISRQQVLKDIPSKKGLTI